MKKILLLILFYSLSINAQMKLGDYNLRISGKTYDINLTQKKFIMIDVPSSDQLSKEIYFKLSFSKAKGFIERMTEAKNKFAEWKLTSEKNNVKDFHKKLNINMGSFDMVFNYGHYYSVNNVDLEAEMLINEYGTYLLINNKRRLVAEDNQFIKTDGFLLTFSNVEEIQKFIDAISISKAEEMFKNNRDSDKLFN